MVDLHSHILFGIDDGAKNLAESIQLAMQARKQGVTHIFCTPHYNDYLAENFFEIAHQHLTVLINELAIKNIDIKLELAAEIAFASDWNKILENKNLFIRDKYLLIEFSDIDIPDYYLDVLYRIRSSGYIPVIAHPERSQVLQKKSDIVMEIIRMGAHFQLDAGSFVGHFGNKVKRTANRFLKSGIYQFYGSDAHDVKYRNYFAFKPHLVSNCQNSRIIENREIDELSVKNIVKQNVFDKFR
jgi:protein-tyrosine phosphatase